MIHPIANTAGDSFEETRPTMSDRSQNPDEARPPEEKSADAVADGGHSARPNHALRWALEHAADPAMAAADWLAADIDKSAVSAVALLASPTVSLDSLGKAKSAFKTMRIVGETSADRRLGARLYAAAIASGLVWHGRRISRQSDGALERAFRGLLDDSSMPAALRNLAGRALCVLCPK